MIAFTPPEKIYGAYLFDCDGTLADTMQLHFGAWKQAVQENGGNIDYTAELFYSMAGMTVPDTIARLNDLFGTELDAQKVGDTKDALYAEMISAVTPIQPVVDFCNELLNTGASVAVVSGSTHFDVNATLEAIGLGEKIKTRVCQGDTLRGKPDPQPFTHAADLLGAPYENCLVLEDSIHAIEGVKKVGMATAFIPNKML